MMGIFGQNGNTQPKPAPVVAMPPRPAPRREPGLPGRELGADAAQIWQDVHDITAERNALLDDVAKLQVALHQSRAETATVREVKDEQIAELKAENKEQRETIDGLADRLAALKSNLHLFKKAAEIIDAELPTGLPAAPKDTKPVGVDMAKLADAIDPPAGESQSEDQPR